ncbi:MAG: hypothetical protein II433_06975, partial [Acidaminococcaceae bacterium]|nr:hypothetical protein [Acidaminococcaceae bacterium]
IAASSAFFLSDASGAMLTAAFFFSAITISFHLWPPCLKGAPAQREGDTLLTCSLNEKEKVI